MTFREPDVWRSSDRPDGWRNGDRFEFNTVPVPISDNVRARMLLRTPRLEGRWADAVDQAAYDKLAFIPTINFRRHAGISATTLADSELDSSLTGDISRSMAEHLDTLYGLPPRPRYSFQEG